VYSLDPEGPRQESVYKELVALCISTTADRAQIEAATGQALSPMEWTGLFLLFFLLLGLIAVLPGGTIPGAIVAGVLAGTLVTFMILLRKLDRLRWHEVVTIWEPTTRLFRNMAGIPTCRAR
jgi:O-antigen/teichoic acid export membrane protein